MMRTLWRPLLIIVVVLLIPIVPFFLVGDQLEHWLAGWSQRGLSRGATALLVAGALSTDILLPIPSSLVSTWGGGTLGTIWGTLASWAGMSVGAVLGFALARRCGRSVSSWFSSERDLDRMVVASRRYGPVALVLARGVPVFAEASVLLLGLHGLSWRRFLPAILASNFGIALAYSAFGQVAAEHAWLPLALGVSIALPLIVTTCVRWWFSPVSRSAAEGEDEGAGMKASGSAGLRKELHHDE